MQRVGEVCCTSPQPFDQHPSICSSSMAADQNSQFSDRARENWSRSHESDDVLEGFMKEIGVRGHEMIKKLVSRVEDDVPFEQVFRETLHHFGGKPAASRVLEKIARKMGRERDDGGSSYAYQRGERGVDDDDDDDDDFKNERFKVKTVQIKEEEDDFKNERFKVKTVQIKEEEEEEEGHD